MAILACFVWLDKQLLKFFNKLVKDFNWLTGKDNFFLARLTVCAMIIWPLWPAYQNKNIAWLVISVISPPYFIFTNLEQRASLVEQLIAARYTRRLLLRSIFMILFILLLIRHHLYPYNDFLPLQSGLILTWNYFCHVDKPPFKRSRAWAKLKSLFSKPVLAPQPQLTPIPVRN